MSIIPFKEVKLGEICNFYLGLTYTPKYVEKGIPFLSVKDLKKDKISFKNTKYISEKEFEESTSNAKPQKGDILFGRVGTLGNPIVIDFDRPFCIFVSLGFIRVHENISNNFIKHWISSNYFMKQVDSQVAGSAQKNLNVGWLKNFKLPLPPLEEQKKIADILSTVDQKIAFVEDNISETQELKKGLRQELFSNGINHSNFKETELGSRPETWEVKKLGDLTSLTAGGTPSTKVEEYWTPQEVPWLSSGEVNKKIVFDTDSMISEEGLNNSAAKLVPKNSVLMGLAGQGKTRGTVAITEIELTTNQSVASILPSEDLDMYFIYHNLDLRYEEIRGMSTGVGGRGGLNLAILRSIKIAIPPLEEQKQIAEILSTVDQKLDTLKQKRDSYEELKKGLMQKLLTGEVRTV